MNAGRYAIFFIIFTIAVFGCFKVLFWTVGVEGGFSASGLILNLGLLIMLLVAVFIAFWFFDHHG